MKMNNIENKIIINIKRRYPSLPPKNIIKMKYSTENIKNIKITI